MKYIGLAVFALLGSAEAVRHHHKHHHSYRPYQDGRTPWYKTYARAPSVGFNHGYSVPNFGVDSDVESTQAHIKAAEGTQKHELKASFAPPPKPYKEYTVPNFGQDQDVKDTLAHHAAAAGSRVQVESTSDPICSSAGCTQYKHKKTPLGYPLNYPVPNNGVDTDIVNTHESVAQAQKDLGHDWEFGTKASKAKWHNVAKDTLYDYAPKLDADMIHTGKHLADTQTKLGHKWVIEEESSYKPNYAQTESELNVESDPICSSAGCTQYKHKKTPLGYPLNYPVVNNGVDQDIIDNAASLADAQANLGHEWEFGTKASKAKWHNVAKDTLYDFAPKLTGDMISTAKNLQDAQTNLGHKWVIEEESSYKPNY